MRKFIEMHIGLVRANRGADNPPDRDAPGLPRPQPSP